MDLPCKERPVETGCKLSFEALAVIACSFTGEFDLPPAQVVQQAHVRLDQHRQSSRAHDEIGVDEGKGKMLHHICDLNVATDSSALKLGGSGKKDAR